MSIGVQVTFDAADPDQLARFWAEILGYQIQPPPEGFESWQGWLEQMSIPKERWNDMSAIVDPDGKGPRLFFQRVPEPKTAKNRCHLDVNAGGPEGTPPDERRAKVGMAVERAVSLGATVLWEKEELGEYWVTLTDPEGNEFCLQ